MKRLKSVLYTCMLYGMMMVLIGQPLTVRAQEAPASESTTTQTESETPVKKKKQSEEEKWRNRQKKEKETPPPAEQSPPPASEQSDAPATDSSASPTTSSAAASAVSGEQASSSSASASQATASTTNNLTIDNKLESTAKSGDADVIANTTAGNATSGNARAEATIINTVHSSIQGQNAGIAEFTADIYGNVNGDITLYPAIKNATSSASNTSSLNANSNNTINNDITMSATSGDATVSRNTTAGNATSGNADTVLNLVNLINSIIAANQSFIGTVNIHGNLNGDILISPEFIPQLLASNHETDSVVNDLVASNTNNTSIVNNINLSAQSGDATIDRNTTAGDAKTGTAQTNLTVLNLTGHEVIAENSVLVFVNVLGKWVGVIADAPVGTTAALLGNGVSSSVVNSQAVNATTNNQITNNVDLSSASGDATVSRNTTAGNATSGNATASANILNISTSSLTLSSWFGILFINVFNEWHGSFGIDTESGNMVALPEPASATTTTVPPVQFGFVPRDPVTPKQATSLPLSPVSSSEQQAAAVEKAQAVLASAKVATQPQQIQTHTAPSESDQPQGNVPFFITVGALVGVPTIALAALVRRWMGWA